MDRQFSDYVVYVDESGDHSLTSINSQYPVFVLVFCIFKIDSYVHEVVPAVQRLKFAWFGHDTVVFHERDIRKRLAPFNILSTAESVNAFNERIADLVETSDFVAVACIIDKAACLETGYRRDDPYRIALEFGLERVHFYLQDLAQTDRTTHVIVESRGRHEDASLAKSFREAVHKYRTQGIAEAFELKFVPKCINSTGLQIADMIARPIGNVYLNPGQPNRAWDVIRPKLRKSRTGEVDGYGLKIVPKKREAPESLGGS